MFVAVRVYEPLQRINILLNAPFVGRSNMLNLKNDKVPIRRARHVNNKIWNCPTVDAWIVLRRRDGLSLERATAVWRAEAKAGSDMRQSVPERRFGSMHPALRYG